ncbi:hypothetical protein BDA99DRAFT_573490 [Phascolomyces articulosus]|uniref:NmrA-like domain-containing protein n=1 Tax=Phascolomyces articulosus TaxID=60185 RepID=A0AAD5PBP0_9FUNG|nr:hypothetical protein BDA99DRAFT_573490 [Phascolomyces articulosus]
MAEKYYLTGATGQIGKVVLQELVKAGVQITVYTRSPDKVPKANNITIVEGDFKDLTPFENSIAGHTRLFLLIADRDNLTNIKIAMGTRAYAAGVKQIVDLSAKRLPYRSYNGLHIHELAEDALYAIKDRGYHVALRPTNFMSNMNFFDIVKKQDRIVDTADPDEKQEWISTTDIGLAGARILLQPVEKHKDATYELVGAIATPAERAAILSKVTGRQITYTQLPVQELYDYYINGGFTPDLSYYLATYQVVDPVSRGLPLLLGRAPESVEVWSFTYFNFTKTTLIEMGL